MNFEVHILIVGVEVALGHQAGFLFILISDEEISN